MGEFDGRLPRRQVIHHFLSSRWIFELLITWTALRSSRPRLAGPEGLKGSAMGESPTAPLVMEMARVVIGQKGDDTSIITPNLDLVSMRLTAIS